MAVGLAPTIWSPYRKNPQLTTFAPSTTSLVGNKPDKESIAQQEEKSSSLLVHTPQYSDDNEQNKIDVPKIFLKTTDEIEAAIPDDSVIPFMEKQLDSSSYVPMTKRHFANLLWYAKDGTEDNKGNKSSSKI